MSQYIDRAVAVALAEDLEDVEAIGERCNGPTESLDDFLKGTQNRWPYSRLRSIIKVAKTI